MLLPFWSLANYSVHAQHFPFKYDSDYVFLCNQASFIYTFKLMMFTYLLDGKQKLEIVLQNTKMSLFIKL